MSIVSVDQSKTVKKVATKIRLLVSDIDGTLVPSTKLLTKESIQMAQRLKKAGIQLCLVSSRPPQGIQLFFNELEITTPFAALNGGEIIGNDGSILASTAIDLKIACSITDLLQSHQVNAWVFGGLDWYVFQAEDPFVAHEEQVVRVQPKVISSLEHHQQRITKIAGVSKDTTLLDQLALKIERQFAGKIKAARSSDHYLDIMHPMANKGYAAIELGKQLGIDISETACIGDMDNDIPMLEKAGLSIAMGQSTDHVKSYADFVTDSNQENGWAHAVEKYILPRA